MGQLPPAPPCSEGRKQLSRAMQLLAWQAPEPAALSFSNDPPLRMHFELPEVEDVEVSIRRVEADIDWSCKWFCHNGMQAPILRVDPRYRTTHMGTRRRSHRSFVTEERQKICPARSGKVGGATSNFTAAACGGKRSNACSGGGSS